MGGLSRAEELILRGCAIDDRAGQQLATGLFQVEAAAELLKLDLGQNPLGGATVNALITMTEDWGAKVRHDRAPPVISIDGTKAGADKVKELGMAWSTANPSTAP